MKRDEKENERRYSCRRSLHGIPLRPAGWPAHRSVRPPVTVAMAHLPSFPAYPRTQTGTGRAVRPTPNDRRIHSQTCAQLYAYGDASSVRSEAIDQRRSVCRARALSQLWRRPTVPSRPPLPFLLLSSPLLILPARERRLDARPFTGDWTFLSSFPPLDVGQARGGRGGEASGGCGARSLGPSRASKSPRSQLGFQRWHHQQHRLLALEAAGGKRTYLRT